MHAHIESVERRGQVCVQSAHWILGNRLGTVEGVCVRNPRTRLVAKDVDTSNGGPGGGLVPASSSGLLFTRVLCDNAF